MDKLIEQMPEVLSQHLKGLMKINDLDGSQESREDFMESWLGKRALFDKIVEHNGFQLVSEIREGFTGGVLLFTYSGSLLILGPEESGKRLVTYNSIGVRKDTVKKSEFADVVVEFPLMPHLSLKTKSSKLKQSSPILAMAVEEVPSGESADKVRIIGERISRSLLVVNQAVFSKNSVESELDARQELFEKWVILSWFRIGGWEAAVFLTRARYLFHELFSQKYNEMTQSQGNTTERDEAFLKLINHDFADFVDKYKWLESEKMDRDIGLLRALEAIPSREDYRAFLKEK